MVISVIVDAVDTISLLHNVEYNQHLSFTQALLNKLVIYIHCLKRAAAAPPACVHIIEDQT